MALRLACEVGRGFQDRAQGSSSLKGVIYIYRRGVRVGGLRGRAYPFAPLRVVMFQRGFMKLHVVASQDMALMISKRDAHYPYAVLKVFYGLQKPRTFEKLHVASRKVRKCLALGQQA